MTRLSLPCKVWLGGEILATYLLVRWSMWRHELPQVVGRLRASARPSTRRPLPDGARDGIRLGRAVIRILSLLPTDSRCLMRSLVLLRLLARRGTEGALVIAVLPTAELKLNAHAWIELDGRPLLPPATDDYGHLVTL